MDMPDLSALHTQVLWAAFAISVAFGLVAQRTHFCPMGAISDVVHMGDGTRLRMWTLAVGVAMLGFHLMVWQGWIDPSRTLYASGRIMWLSALLGGALFGLGMVLASGCGSKTLVRIGGGSLKSLVVFVVMGVAAFATLRGLTAVLRTQTVDLVAFDLATGSALPAWLAARWGGEGPLAGWWLGALAGAVLIGGSLASRPFRAGADNWLAGFGIGACVLALWWVSGHLGFVPEHPETLEPAYLASHSGRIESLTFTAPMAYTLDWLIYYSDAAKRLTTAVVSVFGVVAGAAVYALASRTFRWEGFRDTQDTALHLIGAVCMGVGGVTALGCTIGQGVSGLSTLSITSLFAVAGIVLGALAGLRLQMWLIDRE